MTKIGPLAKALELSARAGSLKYLNLTNNMFSVDDEELIDFCQFLRVSKNLQVLRFHKAIKLNWEMVEALLESESRLTLKALETDILVELATQVGQQLIDKLPNLKNLEL